MSNSQAILSRIRAGTHTEEDLLRLEGLLAEREERKRNHIKIRVKIVVGEENSTDKEDSNEEARIRRVLCEFMRAPKQKKLLLEQFSKYPLETSIVEDEIVKQETGAVICSRRLLPLEMVNVEKLDEHDAKINGERFDWIENETKYTLWFPFITSEFIEKAAEGELQVVAKKHASCWMTKPRDDAFLLLASKGLTREDVKTNPFE